MKILPFKIKPAPISTYVWLYFIVDAYNRFLPFHLSNERLHKIYGFRGLAQVVKSKLIK